MQNKFMRDMYHRFSNLLIMDGTHKINRKNYQLIGFMVVDQYGRGQFVQYTYSESNSASHVACALEHLTL